MVQSNMDEAQRLSAERRQIDEEHALLRRKLEKAEQMLIQGTEKAVSIATMEEAVERMQRMAGRSWYFDNAACCSMLGFCDARPLPQASCHSPRFAPSFPEFRTTLS
jgi:hypothetical protein